MGWIRPPSVTVQAFVLCGILVGGLTESLGLLAGHVEARNPFVLECGTFQAEGRRKSISQVRMVSTARESTSIDVDFLDVDSSVLRSQRYDLPVGGTAEFVLPTGQMGIAVQFIS